MFIGTLLTLQDTYNYHRHSLTVFFFMKLTLLMVKVTVMSALVVFRLHS